MRSTCILAVATASLALSGCQATKEALGLGKRPPDEFQVVSHAPLAMPPTDALVPPDPGAPRPQEQSAAQLAELAVVGTAGGAGEAPLVASASTSGESDSAGEQAFLQSAGAAKADPKIRQLVNQEADAEAQAIKDSLYNKIMFWRKPDPPGTVVDAKAEQQRLQENAALGRPMTEGATPVIVRRKRALLEGIF